jgi:hypothetical protein
MASPEDIGRQAGSYRIVAGERPKPDTIRRYGSPGPPLLPDLVVVARSQNSSLDSSSRFWWRWRVLTIFTVGSHGRKFLDFLSIHGRMYMLLFSTAYLTDTWKLFSKKWNWFGNFRRWLLQQPFPALWRWRHNEGLNISRFGGLQIAQY